MSNTFFHGDKPSPFPPGCRPGRNRPEWSLTVSWVFNYEKQPSEVKSPICYERSTLWIGLSWNSSLGTGLISTWSVINVFCHGHGLLGTGLLWSKPTVTLIWVMPFLAKEENCEGSWVFNKREGLWRQKLKIGCSTSAHFIWTSNCKFSTVFRFQAFSSWYFSRGVMA